MKKRSLSMLCPILGALFLATAASADGTGTHGGDSREMRQAELSREEIRQLLANNGEQLKSRILLPLLANFSPDRVEERWVKENYQTMINGGLRNDILYTYYDIDSPDCRNLGKAAQTQEVPRARICFDVEYLANDGNSIASIAGLALHEHAHHFGINDDGQYRLANYFKYTVIAGLHLQPATRQFGQDGNGALRIEDRSIVAASNSPWGRQREIRRNREQNLMLANRFCQWQGYARALACGVKFFNLSRHDFWSFNQEGASPTPISSDAESGWLFSYITCGR